MKAIFSRKAAIIEQVGENLGYALSYLLFTTLLFFILTFLHKLPQSWTYFHVALTTLLISFAGIILRRLLYGGSKVVF